MASAAIRRVGGQEDTQSWPQLCLRDPVVSLQVSGPFLSQLRGNTLFHKVEQSRAEGLLRRTLEKNTEKRPSYGQKKSADHCFKHVSKTEKGGTGNELQMG